MEEMTAEQIRFHGLQALKRELGVVGMVRPLQQLSNGQGDHSVERHRWLDQLTPEQITEQVNALQQRNAE
jgi:hypothetical protein